MVRHGHGLGEALGLVVDAPGPDGVHVAPVGLGLRVHLRVAVDLARGGQEEPGALAPWPARARCGCRGCPTLRVCDRRCEVVRTGDAGLAKCRTASTWPVDRQHVRLTSCVDEGEAVGGRRGARCWPAAGDEVVDARRPRRRGRAARRQRCEPRNPAPPVTTIRAISCRPMPSYVKPRRSRPARSSRLRASTTRGVGHQRRPPCRGRAT